MLQGVAVRCSALQCELHRVLQCVITPNRMHFTVLQCAVACCNVLQCVAVCRSALQCVLHYVLQCVLQCVLQYDVNHRRMYFAVLQQSVLQCAAV